MRGSAIFLKRPLPLLLLLSFSQLCTNYTCLYTEGPTPSGRPPPPSARPQRVLTSCLIV